MQYVKIYKYLPVRYCTVDGIVQDLSRDRGGEGSGGSWGERV